VGTRDGKGILFVSHDGDVYPSGFLPVRLGTVREENVVEVYRTHPMLRAIRRAEFVGRCGACEYADSCGGSRARAYATFGDPLGEDPACAYRPTAVARSDR
jgi:radical SAM protein with 4Fe4S-binding SPASM domain